MPIPSDESFLRIFKLIWLSLIAYPLILAIMNEFAQMHVIPPHEICLNSSFLAESLFFLKWQRLLSGFPIFVSLITNIYFDFDDTPIFIPAINNQPNAPPNPTRNEAPIKTSYISVAYLAFMLIFALDLVSSITILIFITFGASLKAPLLYALLSYRCHNVNVVRTDNMEMVNMVSISSEGQKQWEAETAL